MADPDPLRDEAVYVADPLAEQAVYMADQRVDFPPWRTASVTTS